MMNQRL